MRTTLFCLWVLSLGGCTYAIQDIPTVPAQPTYHQDVQPFLADHCVLCHGSPPDRGAPSNFRLDVYGGANSTPPGAADMANSILHDLQVGRMPPGGGVGANAMQMMQNWVNDGTLP
jgi:hypothetical protein